jgi:general secretion pathway protein I
MNTASAERGFTLIEAMVALVVLGIAAVGIVRATEAHVDTLRALERRTAALWVAENALTEARLGSAPAAGSEAEMLGWRWRVAVSMVSSEDPDLARATVKVSPAGSDRTMVSLTGFVDKRTVTR